MKKTIPIIIIALVLIAAIFTAIKFTNPGAVSLYYDAAQLEVPKQIGESFVFFGLQNTNGNLQYVKLTVNNEQVFYCAKGKCLPETNGPRGIGEFRKVAYTIDSCGTYNYIATGMWINTDFSQSGTIIFDCPPAQDDMVISQPSPIPNENPETTPSSGDSTPTNTNAVSEKTSLWTSIQQGFWKTILWIYQLFGGTA